MALLSFTLFILWNVVAFAISLAIVGIFGMALYSALFGE